MKDFIKKHKIVLILMIYILLVGAVFYFVIKYLFSGIDSNNNKIQETMLDQENQKKRIDELPKLQEQYQMLGMNEGKMTYLLTEDRAVDLIKEVEDLAEKTGNSINIEMLSDKDKNAVKKQNVAKKDNGSEDLRASLPGADYLEMNIHLTGEYSNLLSFMKKIENMEYYDDIVSIIVSVDDESNKSDALSPFSNTNTVAANQNPDQQNSGNPAPEQKTKINSTIDAVFYLKK
jgi:Tfp pilus assembly protein PilO